MHTSLFGRIEYGLLVKDNSKSTKLKKEQLEKEYNLNQGQEKFYQFILERVQEKNVEDAKALLKESFAKQANGTFDQNYLKDFNMRIIVLLKPECVDEVKHILENFRG